jgi:tight adherence protein B
MRRLILLLAIAGAVLASHAAGATTAANAPPLAETGSRFPDKYYVLTVPKRQRLTAAQVRVTENGQPVDHLTVTTPGQQTATMLLIDASLTMRGKPMADALAAARAFAAQRKPSQQLGIATFNASVDELLPFTSNSDEIDDALSATPPTAYGTVVYDAVEWAAEQIKQSGARVGTIVLLADGQNVGSKNTLADAVERLKEDGIRLFSVGLRSPAYYGPPLRRMADISGGTYSEASDSGSLTKIYNALGFRLANEYLLLYRSLEGPDEDVKVAVRVPGYAPMRVSYTTPALGLTSGPVDKSTFDEILQSWPFMLLLVLVIVGLLVYAVRAILDLRRRSLRQRMAQFVEMGGEEVNLLSREELAARIRDFEQSIESTGWVGRFAEECEIGFVKQPPMTLLLGSFAVSAFAAVVLGALWSPFAFLLFPLGPILVVLYVNRRVSVQRKLFAEQLPDNLDVLAQGLRVGHSLVGGLAYMCEDAAEPSRREFKRVVTDEQLGIPLEDAMKKVAVRMESHDMEHVALVAMLQRETGGASAEVIDQVSDNIRGRMEVRRLVRTLTAQGRLARWIVSLMPVALILGIFIIFPKYLEPLFNSGVGVVGLIMAAICVVLGSYVIGRIVEIKV